MLHCAEQVVNDSKEPRLILLVDFTHPDINRQAGNSEEFNWSR